MPLVGIGVILFGMLVACADVDSDECRIDIPVYLQQDLYAGLVDVPSWRYEYTREHAEVLENSRTERYKKLDFPFDKYDTVIVIERADFIARKQFNMTTCVISPSRVDVLFIGKEDSCQDSWPLSGDEFNEVVVTNLIDNVSTAMRNYEYVMVHGAQTAPSFVLIYRFGKLVKTGCVVFPRIKRSYSLSGTQDSKKCYYLLDKLMSQLKISEKIKETKKKAGERVDGGAV